MKSVTLKFMCMLTMLMLMLSACGGSLEVDEPEDDNSTEAALSDEQSGDEVENQTNRKPVPDFGNPFVPCNNTHKALAALAPRTGGNVYSYVYETAIKPHLSARPYHGVRSCFANRGGVGCFARWPNGCSVPRGKCAKIQNCLNNKGGLSCYARPC